MGTRFEWCGVSRNSLGEVKGVNQVDGDLDLEPTFTFRLDGGRAQQRKNDSVSTSVWGKVALPAPALKSDNSVLRYMSLEVLSCCPSSRAQSK